FDFRLNQLTLAWFRCLGDTICISCLFVRFRVVSLYLQPEPLLDVHQNNVDRIQTLLTILYRVVYGPLAVELMPSLLDGFTRFWRLLDGFLGFLFLGAGKSSIGEEIRS